MSAVADLIREELKARKWSAARLYWESNLSVRDIVGLLHENADMTPAIAAGLARAFGTGAEFWLKLGGGVA